MAGIMSLWMAGSLRGVLLNWRLNHRDEREEIEAKKQALRKMEGETRHHALNPAPQFGAMLRFCYDSGRV